MIWLLGIFSIVAASKKEEACIVIAEKAVYIKADVLKAIIESHPELDKGDLRRRVVQDIYYNCLKDITYDEYKDVEFLKFMSFKKFEHLMSINPDKYVTKESLELYSFYEKKYQELMKIKSQKISERTGQPVREFNLEEETEKPQKNKKNSNKAPSGSKGQKNEIKVESVKINTEKQQSRPESVEDEGNSEKSHEANEGLQGESQQAGKQREESGTSSEKPRRTTRHPAKPRNKGEDKASQEKFNKKKEEL